MSRFVVAFLAPFLLACAGIAQSTSSSSSEGQATSSQQTVTTQSTVISSNQPSPAEQEGVKQNLQDVHFAFDSYELDNQNLQSLQESANWLKANPDVTVSIAGDADERGGIVYNLALSQKRAEATRDALVADGVSAGRIEFATGWGKLYPICNLSDESCWAENRHVHMTAGTMLQTEQVAHALQTLPVLACALKDCQ